MKKQRLGTGRFIKVFSERFTFPLPVEGAQQNKTDEGEFTFIGKGLQDAVFNYCQNRPVCLSDVLVKGSY